MLVSLKMLNRYVDTSGYTPAQIGALLTELGLELESITEVPGLHAEIVIAEIASTRPHPEADRLQLCRVRTSENGDLQDVVCGAPNARAGIRVAFAQVGAVLPGGLKIKRSKIRGEPSAGMLCSEAELGLSHHNEGIVELAAETKLGTALAQIYPRADTVLNLALTANRADASGVLGVARDLAAKLNRPLHDPYRLTPGTLLQVQPLRNECPDLVPRFRICVLENVKVLDTSPHWLRRSLEAVGMRSVNSLVDCANFVMLEAGHPVHAYDGDFVDLESLTVRQARAGESYEALDGETRSLDPENLVISDAAGILGSPVIGGSRARVGLATTRVVLECAVFARSAVREMSRHLGVRSEASVRFERGVSEHQVAAVLQRFVELVGEVSEELGLTRPVGPVYFYESYPEPSPLPRIALRVSRAQAVLHLPQLNEEICRDILQRLGFEFLDGTQDRILVEVPAHRLDIQREADLIDEVGRVYGLDQIPLVPPQVEASGDAGCYPVRFEESVRRSCAEGGFCEIVQVPFVAEGMLSALRINPGSAMHPTVRLQNPLQAASPWLCSSLAPNLVEALVTNRRKGQFGVRLFEVGRAYHLREFSGIHPWTAHLAGEPSFVGPRAVADDMLTRPVSQRRVVGWIVDVAERCWGQDPHERCFFAARQAVERLALTLRLPSPQASVIEPEAFPFLHPGAAALLAWGDTPCGYVGELHPLCAEKLGYAPGHATPALAEIDLDLWLSQLRRPHQAIDPQLRVYPAVSRDATFVSRREITYNTLERAVASFTRRKFLRRHLLLDLYQPATEVPRLHWTLRFEYESATTTLTDAQVEREHTALVAHMSEQLRD